jgi:hypothetical protein
MATRIPQKKKNQKKQLTPLCFQEYDPRYVTKAFFANCLNRPHEARRKPHTTKARPELRTP